MIPSRLPPARRISFAVVAAACLPVFGAGCGSSQAGLRLEVQERPFKLTVVRDGKTVVAEDAAARLRYKLASNDAVHELTDVTSREGDVYEVATDEPGRTATVSVARKQHGFHVSVRVHPEADVAQVFDSFEARPNEHYLGGGQRGEAVDLRGQILPGKVSFRCTYAPVPYFAATGGWGVRLDTQAITGLAFPGSPGGADCIFGTDQPCSFPPLEDRVEVCQVGARLDQDIYVGSMPAVLAAYEADAGRPRIPPRSQFGLIKWRDVVSGPGQVLDDIARFRAAKIPIGWVELDNPWEACVGTLTFDRSRIPDPAGLIRQVHERGVRFMLWVSPNVECPERHTASALLGPDDAQVLDLTDEATYSAFRTRLGALIELGVDGFKADRGDEVDLHEVGPTVQNRYPLLFARAVSEVLPKDGAAIFRAATMGSQSVIPALWGGDQPGDWDGLRTAVRLGQTAGMSGFPVWGTDIGGYQSVGLEADVFARWAGLGAVSPVMEVGGKGPNATPWKLGPTALEALRRAAVLHYELVPYFEDLLRKRRPVIRPLGYGYPGDPNAWNADLELLVGPHLLAAPVTEAGETAAVYLPPGTWIDLDRGTTVEGGQGYARPTPLTELPLYVRSGAVLPFNLRTARDSWWGIDELGHPGRAGFLATNGATVRLLRQPRDVQLYVPADRKPGAVTLGGKKVAWSWNAGPLPGVVVRLHGPTVRGRIALWAE